MTVWRMHIACWIHKCTNTHSEHVIIIAFFRSLISYANASHCQVYTKLPVSLYVVCNASEMYEDSWPWGLPCWYS